MRDLRGDLQAPQRLLHEDYESPEAEFGGDDRNGSQSHAWRVGEWGKMVSGERCWGTGGSCAGGDEGLDVVQVCPSPLSEWGFRKKLRECLVRVSECEAPGD